MSETKYCIDCLFCYQFTLDVDLEDGFLRCPFKDEVMGPEATCDFYQKDAQGKKTLMFCEIPEE